MSGTCGAGVCGYNEAHILDTGVIPKFCDCHRSCGELAQVGLTSYTVCSGIGGLSVAFGAGLHDLPPEG